MQTVLKKRGNGQVLAPERKAAESGAMSDEQYEFLMAIEEWKRENSRGFPTWTEVLEVVKSLGYRKREKAEEIVIPDNYPQIIRAQRRRLGITQVFYAQRLRIRPETVSRWENGKEKPSPEKWRYITSFLM